MPMPCGLAIVCAGDEAYQFPPGLRHEGILKNPADLLRAIYFPARGTARLFIPSFVTTAVAIFLRCMTHPDETFKCDHSRLFHLSKPSLQ